MRSETAPPIRPGTAEHYTWGGGCDGWFLKRSPEITVIQERMPPRTEEVRHVHRQAWQFFYVLTGELAVYLEDVRQVLRSMEGVEVQPGTVHQVRNESDGDVQFLVISMPDSHGDRTAV